MQSNFWSQCPCPRRAPIQQRQPQLKPVATEARQLLQGCLWDKSLYSPPHCVSSVTATLARSRPPWSGHREPGATRTTWKFTGVTIKGITWFPAATLPLTPATVISLPAGFLAPEGDQQTIWSLQGGWLAVPMFSPSPAWVMLGCVQHLMSVWQDSSVTLRSFAKAEGQWVWCGPPEEPLCSHQQGPTPSSGTARGTLHV